MPSTRFIHNETLQKNVTVGEPIKELRYTIQTALVFKKILKTKTIVQNINTYRTIYVTYSISYI